METELSNLLCEYQIANNWAFVAIITIIFALLVRHLLIGRMLRTIKKVNKEIYKAVTKSYIKKSIFGWVFFLAGITIVELVWFGRLPILKFIGEGGWLIIALLSFLFGTYLHLYAYTSSVTDILKERIGIEKGEF